MKTQNFENLNENQICGLEACIGMMAQALAMENEGLIVRSWAELAAFRIALDNEAAQKEALKAFWTEFSKLDVARIKAVSKAAIKSDNVTRSNQERQLVCRVLFRPIDEQRTAVRNMLKAAMRAKKEINERFPLAYTHKEYLDAFNTLSDEEFKNLYEGSATTLRAEKVLGRLTVIIKAAKVEAKRAAKGTK